jgi:hypothetical protein
MRVLRAKIFSLRPVYTNNEKLSLVVARQEATPFRKNPTYRCRATRIDTNFIVRLNRPLTVKNALANYNARVVL